MRARAMAVVVLASAVVLARAAPASAQDAGPQLLAPDEVPAAPVDLTPDAGPDRVRLKDGSVTSGAIVVERPGLYVALRLANGTDVVIRWDEIEKIERGARTSANGRRSAAPPAISDSGAICAIGSPARASERRGLSPSCPAGVVSSST